MPTATPVNAQMVDWLRAYFPSWNDTAFMRGMATSLYQMLPQLHGFWPMSANDINVSPEQIFDLSGAGRTLDGNGAITFSTQGLTPYVNFDSGGSEYLNRADEAGLDVIDAGLTVGCWVNFDNAAGTLEGVISKGGTANNRNYSIVRLAAGTMDFRITNSAGSATDGVTHSGITTAQNTWYFVAGRWAEGVEARIFVNDETSVDSSIFAGNAYNSGQDFVLGARGDGVGGTQDYMDGQMALAFLCNNWVSANYLNMLYGLTRHLFGV